MPLVFAQVDAPHRCQTDVLPSVQALRLERRHVSTTKEAAMSNPRCKHEEAKRRALECDRPAMIDCERYETDRPRREHIAPGGSGIDNGWAEDSRKGVRHA